MTCNVTWMSASLLVAFLREVTASPAPTAYISSGAISGLTVLPPNATNQVNKFLGIPFAAPPIDDLRFELAQPPLPWGNTSVLNATAYGDACMQANEASTLFVGQSEDCLYLNVFAPSKPPSEGDEYAVMLYIHGGGLVAGSAADAKLDGTSFAANQDVIIVTINYRLNVFGFVNSPAVPIIESNLGFYDQRMALSWVQNNIAAFGGDPHKVTIFGESSGSTSVSRLVETMTTDTPFRAAILESGWADTAAVMNEYNISSCGEGAWNLLVAGLACGGATEQDELACVKAMDARAIYDFLWNNTGVLFTAVNDNVTALSRPIQARVEGKIAKVSILTGTNRNEGTLWTSAETLADEIALYPQLAPFEEALAAAYVVGTPGIPNQWYANAAIDTDVEYVCPTSIAAGQTAALGVPVWRYMYNATFPNTDEGASGVYPAIDGYGVYHSAEIPLVWGTYSSVNATAGEVQLSKVMQKAWADFAKDPYVDGPGWPRYTISINGSSPIAALGSANGNPVGWSIFNSGTLDKDCGIYQSLYEEYEGVVPWW